MGRWKLPPNALGEIEEFVIPRVKVAITKKLAFQGKDEEFANVYTYDNTATDAASLESLVDAVVNGEKLVYDTSVTFVRAQVWDVGLVPNLMRFTKELTGTGSGSGTSGVYRESAVLVKWPLPRRQGLNRTIHRSLRKWLHTAHLPASMSGGGTVAGGGTPVPGSSYANYSGIANEPIAGVRLCAPNGDLPTGPMRIQPYLEHRQFRRGRKEG